MDIEIGRLVVLCFHDWRRCGTDPQAAALPDPVDVAVAVHHDRASRDRLQSTNKPAAVDQGRPDPHRESRYWHRVLYDVVVNRHDPPSLRKLTNGGFETTDLLGRDHPECIGEGEMRLGV